MIAIEAPELVQLKGLVNTGLSDLFAQKAGVLWQAMGYGTLGAGKRVRALLTLAACQALTDDPKPALPAAIAIELVHAFSLIHDDLPAMDNSPERRGQPSCHAAFGDAVALLAGDALLALAFQCLAKQGDVRLVDELALATGADGMCGGQVLDIQGTDDVETLHRLKTGALFRCALRLGALSGGANEAQLSELTGAGEQIGLAFQIVDDLLDMDEDEGPSYVRRFGADEARRIAQEQIAQILDRLSSWPASADPLRRLCRIVIERSS